MPAFHIPLAEIIDILVATGERLTRDTLDFIADTLAHGGKLRGASDRTLETVRVVIE